MGKRINEGGFPSNEKMGYDEFISKVYDMIIAKGFEDPEAVIMTGEESYMFEEVLGEYFEMSQHEPSAVSYVVPVLIDMYNRQYSTQNESKNESRAKFVNGKL